MKSEKILNDFKKFNKPLIITESGSSFNRYHYQENFDLFIDYKQKNELGSELLTIKLVNPDIQKLVDAKNKLEDYSNELCQKITYLSENFKLIEIDSKNNQAQIRSYPPYTKVNERLFFEILINAPEESLTLWRKSRESSTHRESRKSFILNDEILLRLLKDLTETE